MYKLNYGVRSNEIENNHEWVKCNIHRANFLPGHDKTGIPGSRQDALLLFRSGQGVAGPNMDAVKGRHPIVIIPDHGIPTVVDHFVLQAVGVSWVGKRPDLDIKVAGGEILMGQEAFNAVVVDPGSNRFTQGTYPDQGRAILHDIEFMGRGQAQVEYPAFDKGAAVVDPYHDFPAVFKIFDEQHGLQGQGFMGRGAGVHIVAFAAGGFAAVEFPAVPGGNPGFDIAFGRRQGVIDPAIDNIRPLGCGNGRSLSIIRPCGVGGICQLRAA